MPRPKRIMIRANSHARLTAGPAHDTPNLVRGLTARGFRVIVVLTSHCLFESTLRLSGIPCFVVKPGKTSARKILSLMRQHQIQIAQTMDYISDCCRAAAILGIPHVWHVRTRFEIDAPRLSKEQLEDRLQLMSRMSIRIVCISRFVASQFSFLPKGKVKIIHNGMDMKQLPKRPCRKDSPIAAKYRIASQTPTVGMVGKIVHQKRPEDFIRMAALVKNELPNVHFLIAGASFKTACPGYYKRLKELTTRLHLNKCLHFLGHQKDIMRVIALMDVVVVPAVSEGLSNVVIEAMASGKPVIACTDCGGPSELIVSGRTGLLVERNAPNLADAVLHFLRDKKMRLRFGKNAKARIRQFFLSSQMIDRFVSLYADI